MASGIKSVTRCSYSKRYITCMAKLKISEAFLSFWLTNIITDTKMNFIRYMCQLLNHGNSMPKTFSTVLWEKLCVFWFWFINFICSNFSKILFWLYQGKYFFSNSSNLSYVLILNCPHFYLRLIQCFGVLLVSYGSEL